jgi:hypothetical protein
MTAKAGYQRAAVSTAPCYEIARVWHPFPLALRNALFSRTVDYFFRRVKSRPDQVASTAQTL